MKGLEGLPFKLDAEIGGGRFAMVYGARGERGALVIKVARHAPHDGGEVTGAVLWSRGRRFVTGNIDEWSPSPNEVVNAEAAVLARVTHSAFPRWVSQGTVVLDGVPRSYLAMERVLGRSWRDAMSSNAPPTLQHLLAAATALKEVADTRQMRSHGDIKPDNLMLDMKGRVFVIDPACGMTERDARGRPRAALLTEVYNPFYADSDVPALGLVLWEMLLQKQPFVASDARRLPHRYAPALERVVRAMTALGRGRLLERLPYIELPREARADIPEELEALALRCVGLKRFEGGLDSVEAPSLAELVATLGRYRDYALPRRSP